MGLSQRKMVTAIDIGSSAVKVVELIHDRKSTRLGRYGLRDIDPDMRLDPANQKELSKATIAGVVGLLAELSISPSKVRNLVTCVSGQHVSIKQISSVALSDAELDSALVFEARKHLPVEGEVLMDYQVISPAEAGRGMEILLVVTTRQSVVSHGALLERCGLKPGTIDAPPLSLANSYLLGSTDQAKNPVVLINVGAISTTVCINHPGARFFTREIPVAGRNFTDDLRSRTGEEPAATERRKRSGAPDSSQGTGLSMGSEAGLTLVSKEQQNRSLESLGREIMRSLRFFMKENNVESVGRFMVCGGSALERGFAGSLGKLLGTEVETMDPFAWSGVAAANGPQYAQAMGMALRGMHDLLQN